MPRAADRPPSRIAAAIFSAIDPIPYGLFCAALIFDAIYTRSGELLWVKSAAWLIAMGLLFAVIPRFINLAQVWFPGSRLRSGVAMLGFWLNAGAIAVAIANAFVHSRDAYGAMPEGLWLSCATMLLLVLARVMPALSMANERSQVPLNRKTSA